MRAHAPFILSSLLLSLIPSCGGGGDEAPAAPSVSAAGAAGAAGAGGGGVMAGGSAGSLTAGEGGSRAGGAGASGAQAAGAGGQVPSGSSGGGGKAGSPSSPPPLPDEPDPGSSVSPSPGPEAQAKWQAVEATLGQVSSLSADELLSKHAVGFQPGLGYAPGEASGLSTIQASGLALDEKELAALGENGFVISERERFPSFMYGYRSLYAADLPLYVSADSILHAVHRSYDEALKRLESAALIPELRTLLIEMRASLAQGGPLGASPRARADADLLLSVGLSLLDAPSPPVAGADPEEAASIVQQALDASGAASLSLLGIDRQYDFSQFKPRGHYTESPALQRYFRAMMWFGRTELPLMVPNGIGKRVFHRRQLEAALTLRELMGQAGQARYGRIDEVLRSFVGEPDSMSVEQLEPLLAPLGVSGLEGLAKVSDEQLAQALVDGAYGEQKILSQIIEGGQGPGGGPTPLPQVFLLFGQRYVVDSHVFSNVVYDRVPSYRMMPSPLDVAYAALGNDHAASLLSPELSGFDGYPAQLEKTRLLVDAHGDSFWGANLYNGWLSSIRSLSPSAEVTMPQAAGLPRVAATEAWGRRLLNTQLASWAELRHDTILYAKQSYTSGAECSFPDAYVEPYPELFARLEAYASRGKALASSLDLPAASGELGAIVDHYSQLGVVSSLLRQMAEAERKGEPLTAEQMAFINEAVVIQESCGGPATATAGWYARLFLDKVSNAELDPTIADVHTQATDEVGTPVGRVLHVATGMPRLMVVTVDTCNGPRAYAGLASSYFEKITDSFSRLDDKQWSDTLLDGTPPDVPWMAPLVVR